MGQFTLMTFLLECPSVVHTVELLGSWDNFTKPYPMKRDTRRSASQWAGCHSFTDIICDGDIQNLTPRRDGGLKMGGLYWYYYRLDGHMEWHDSCEPSTTSCPLLPGQRVNILDVPCESRSRSPSISSKSSDIYTLNPADKYVNPIPPPILPTCFEIDRKVERLIQTVECCDELSFERVGSSSIEESEHRISMWRDHFRNSRPKTATGLPTPAKRLSFSSLSKKFRARPFSEGCRARSPDYYETTAGPKPGFTGVDSDDDVWKRRADDADSAIFVKPENLHIAGHAQGFDSLFPAADRAQADAPLFYEPKTMGPPTTASTLDFRTEEPFGLDHVLLDLERVQTGRSYDSHSGPSDSEGSLSGNDTQSLTSFPLWQHASTDFQYLVPEDGPIQSPSFSLHTASSSGILTPNRMVEHQEKGYFPHTDYFHEDFGGLQRVGSSSDAVHVRPRGRDVDTEFCAALGISELLSGGPSGSTSLGVDFDDYFSHRNIFSHKDASQGTITPMGKITSTEQRNFHLAAHAEPSRSLEPPMGLGQIDSLIDDFAYLGGAVS